MGESSKLLWQHFFQIASQIYSENESQAIAFLLLEKKYGCSKLQVLADFPLSNTPNPVEVGELEKRLLANEPVQYILREAEFMGGNWYVNPSVLIPRPETEELVHWICKEEGQRPSFGLLDVGTGSGCIAISLAKKIPQAHVAAVDISRPALQIAKKNALAWDTSVAFFELDVLKNELADFSDREIWVSNPPYVLPSEKANMQQNVLSHEPEKALFVPQEQPLIFYERLLEQGKKYLTPKGKIYFEINERFGQKLKELAHKYDFRQIELRQDIHGKDRFLKVEKA